MQERNNQLATASRGEDMHLDAGDASVLMAFAYGPGGSEARVYAVARDHERQLHETLGLVVLALIMLRLLWRAFDARPARAPLARWMDIAAKSVQAALYALLFAVPLTAVTGAWLEGHPLTLLGAVTLASPWAESHALGAGGRACPCVAG